MKSGETERMKIATITCHNVYNVGASLQAYALVRYLQDLGHDVQIIDYEPSYLRHYKLWGVDNPAYDRPVLREIYGALKLPRRIRARHSLKKRQFDAFTRKYLPLTKKMYASNEELRCDPPQAELYIAGSDQIWNPYFKNGLDPAFYLEFAPKGAVRASYAASFAVERVKAEEKEKIIPMLNQFDFISVRESTGLDILQSMGMEHAWQVLDPVFLPDPSIWQKLSEKRLVSEPYVLIYDFDWDVGKEIPVYFNSNGKMVKSTITEIGQVEMLDRNVYECIFKPGSNDLLQVKGIGNLSKMHDFLQLLGLDQDNLLADYSMACSILSDKTEESRAYLTQVIDSTANQGKRM